MIQRKKAPDSTKPLPLPTLHQFALLVILALGPAKVQPAIPSPQIIAGQVQANGQPLGNVLVSDGRRVVQTDSSGRYELPAGPDSGPFIFVTTPRGFWTDSFYVPMERAATAGRACDGAGAEAQPVRDPAP